MHVARLKDLVANLVKSAEFHRATRDNVLRVAIDDLGHFVFGLEDGPSPIEVIATDLKPFEPTLVNMLEVARLAGCKSMIFRFSDD